MFPVDLHRSSVMACASAEFGQKYAIGIDAATTVAAATLVHSC